MQLLSVIKNKPLVSLSKDNGKCKKLGWYMMNWPTHQQKDLLYVDSGLVLRKKFILSWKKNEIFLTQLVRHLLKDLTWINDSGNVFCDYL